MWANILVFLKLVFAIFNAWTEKDKARKAKKKEAVKEVKNGLAKNDPSAITAGFAKLKRL